MTQQIVDLGPDLNIRKLGAAFSPGANVRYVRVGGDDNDDGRTWATAKASIANAVTSLPTIGAGGQLRHAGEVEVGWGVFTETSPIRVGPDLMIRGRGTGESGKISGTTIALGYQGHLMDHLATFTDFYHHFSLQDVILHGDGRSGAFDLLRIRNGGFNCELRNVRFYQAPRYGLNVIRNAVSLFLINTGFEDCVTGAIKFDIESGAGNSHLGIFGCQIDDCGQWAIDITDASTNDTKTVYIADLEAESNSASIHDAVVRYTGPSSGSGVNFTCENVTGWRSAAGADAVLYAPSATVPATWKCSQVHGNSNYPKALDDVAAGYSSVNNHIMDGIYSLGLAQRIEHNGVLSFVRSGDPESTVTAPVGSMYRRTDGGANTTLYIKETGTGNTGWAAI